MKSLTITFCCILLFYFTIHAQSDSWIVKAGQEIKEAVPPGVLFRYPLFLTGNVNFKDGKNSEAPLDLNLLNQEMQFVDNHGDTLAITNEATINYISINTDTFYYSQGFVELVTGNSNARLGKKQRLKVGDIKKVGAYGQASSSSAISSLSSINNGAEVTKLSLKQDLLLVKEITYYIGDKYNRFLPASKKNIMKMFERQQPALEDFFKENKIRFNNADDLKTLIGFLQKAL